MKYDLDLISTSIRDSDHINIFFYQKGLSSAFLTLRQASVEPETRLGKNFPLSVLAIMIRAVFGSMFEGRKHFHFSPNLVHNYTYIWAIFMPNFKLRLTREGHFLFT